jgi:ribosomal protein S18 acetylase RimI-like enzyme
MASRLAPLPTGIRPAQAEDRDFLLSLSERAFRPYADHPDHLMLRMMRNQSGEILIAERALGGRAVKSDRRLGFAVISVRHTVGSFGPWSHPSAAHLDAIAVRPHVSGRGVGRRLLMHAEEVARRRGAVSISLLTAVGNERARRLFLGAGYQLITLLDGVYADDQPGLAMLKALCDSALFE